MDRRTDLLYKYRASVCWRAIKIKKKIQPKEKVHNALHITGGLSADLNILRYDTQRRAFSARQLSLLLGAVSWPSGQANGVLGRLTWSGRTRLLFSWWSRRRLCIRATWHFGGSRQHMCAALTNWHMRVNRTDWLTAVQATEDWSVRCRSARVCTVRCRRRLSKSLCRCLYTYRLADETTSMRCLLSCGYRTHSLERRW